MVGISGTLTYIFQQMKTVKEDMVLETAVIYVFLQLMVMYVHVMLEEKTYKTDKHVQMVV